MLAGIAAISLFIFWKRGWIFAREDYNVIDMLDADEKIKGDNSATTTKQAMVEKAKHQMINRKRDAS